MPWWWWHHQNVGRGDGGWGSPAGPTTEPCRSPKRTISGRSLASVHAPLFAPMRPDPPYRCDILPLVATAATSLRLLGSRRVLGQRLAACLAACAPELRDLTLDLPDVPSSKAAQQVGGKEARVTTVLLRCFAARRQYLACPRAMAAAGAQTYGICLWCCSPNAPNAAPQNPIPIPLRHAPFLPPCSGAAGGGAAALTPGAEAGGAGAAAGDGAGGRGGGLSAAPAGAPAPAGHGDGGAAGALQGDTRRWR